MEKIKKSPDSAKKNEMKAKTKSSPESNREQVSQEVQNLTRCTRFRLSTEYELSICNCKHIMRMTIKERHSVVNPQKWLCNICCTTESVWACLSCPNVACGRFIHEHALNHYLETNHPLVIDVNELYVYCYECEEYVLNDNKSGDLKVLRETLQAIRYQNFTGTTRSGHTLRTAAISADEDVQMRRRLQQQQLDRDDRNFTAIWHSRFVRQRKTFRHWLHYVKCKRKRILMKEMSSDDNSDAELSIKAKDYSKSPIQLKHPVPSFNFSEDSNSSASDTKTMLDKSSTQITASCQLLCKEDLNESDITDKHQSPDHSCPVVTSSLPISASIKPEVQKFEAADAFADSRLTTITTTPLSVQNNVSNVKQKSPAITPTSPLLKDVNNRLLIPETKFVILVTSTSNSTSRESSSEEDISKGNVPVLAPKEARIPSSPLTGEHDKKEPAEDQSPIQQHEEIGSSTIDDFDMSDADIPLAQLSTEIVRRPKRANAASRYKAIINQLSPSFTSNEPIKKRLRTFPQSQEGSFQKSGQRRSVRLSLRMLEADKRKSKSEKRKRKRAKKPPSRAANQQLRRRTKAERKLPCRTLPNRRSRMQSLSKSIYDSIPNRAVTSLIPGVTGLRNLGNTCYLNSIIQVLGHLQKFRRCLLAVQDLEIEDKLSGERNSASRQLTRRSTIEMYESQMSKNVARRFLKMQAGLNGGHESGISDKSDDASITFSPKRRRCSPTSPHSLSLCHELHDLYHVMWSGKWKLVSPYHFLSSVWQLIPSFRGYSQQDAQEFLCELLDKIVSELERRKHHSQASRAERLATKISRVVHTVFEGRLHSQVRCLECKNVSSTYEPFWDLSLEFPQRYHSTTTNSWKNSNQGCNLIEMLEKFTEAERLDGGCVYSCAQCNNLYYNQSRDTRQRRLSVKSPSQKLSEAEKQIKIVSLPQVLRFHLKRFRWSGRNNREKITVPVNFPAELDMKPYCWMGSTVDGTATFTYDLSAVVIHHGRGFSAGHYTAYCWNDTGKFWVHCNDSNLELCSIDDVMAAQAYILFYSQRGLDPHPHLSTPPTTPDLSPPVTPDFLVTKDGIEKISDDAGNG